MSTFTTAEIVYLNGQAPGHTAPVAVIVVGRAADVPRTPRGIEIRGCAETHAAGGSDELSARDVEA